MSAPVLTTAPEIASPTAGALSGIYHDIYDFSLFPISLGDIVTWSVKSALRAETAGRAKVHVHVVCDPGKSGLNAFQSGNYLTDLLVMEVLPAFYSHPRFCGISVHRSREDFHEAFDHIAGRDGVAARVLGENRDHYNDRQDFIRTIRYFSEQCTFHHDINDYFRRTGTFPHLTCLSDCLLDWQALQSQYRPETFWVCVQFRLRRLDAGMPIGAEGLGRDAPFLAWFDFIKTAATALPFVRFVVLGRLQEKPLELLRLPNVVVLRPLGMGLAHELTALLNCDHFMGSPSGFAQAAHFSDTPYDVFSCDEAGCKNYGIPVGTPRLPNAHARQILHFARETPDRLLSTLEQAITAAPGKTAESTLQMGGATTTNRFFLNEAQSDAELLNILSSCLLEAARLMETGDLAGARHRLAEMEKSFPPFVALWPDFQWLTKTATMLAECSGVELSDEQTKSRREALREVARYCHPTRLIRRIGRAFDNLLVAEGFLRDGWCEKRARLVFGPSEPGDYLVIHVNRTSSSRPQRTTFRINNQPPVTCVLLNDVSVVELPVLAPAIPTELVVESDYAQEINSQMKTPYSFLIEEAGLVSELAPMLPWFRGDKHELRGQAAAGIASNGWASSLVRLRLDNPLPAGTRAMVSLAGMLPRFRQYAQHFIVQVNDGPEETAMIRGRYFSADLPLSEGTRHAFITLRFPGRDRDDVTARDLRARVLRIEIVPALTATPVIRSGLRGLIAQARQKWKAKREKARRGEAVA